MKINMPPMVRDSLRKKKPPRKYRKIEIDMAPPSYWRWRAMHWTEQQKLVRAAVPLVKVAVDQAKIKTIKTPVLISVDVYKVRGRRGDAHNLITAVDKLFIDTLTSPRGNKQRGLGVIPDDSPDYMTLGTPVVHIGAPADKTVLTFKPLYKSKKKARNRKEGINDTDHQD